MAFPNEETQFTKGESGNPKGRPPKLETVLKRHFLGEHGERLSNSQVKEIIESLLSLSWDELNAIQNDSEMPMWVVIAIKKMKKDFDKGSFEIVEKLLDRAHGKPKNTNEVTGKNGSDLAVKIDLSNASIEELERLINTNNKE